LVKLLTAALAAEYPAVLVKGRKALIEDMFMIEPPSLFSFIKSPNFLVLQNISVLLYNPHML